MNLKDRLLLGCGYLVKILYNLDSPLDEIKDKNSLLTNTEKLQSISLLLSASKTLNRSELQVHAEHFFNKLERHIFSNENERFFLDDGKILTFDNIILASIYSKLNDKNGYIETFNSITGSLTNNSVSIYYPTNKDEVSFHLLPMISLLNFLANESEIICKTYAIDMSYYLADIYNTYSIDISHEISYAVWMNSILGAYEGDSELQDRAKKILKILSDRTIEGMSSLYAAIYQQSLNVFFKDVIKPEEHNDHLKILNHQFSFQTADGAFIQRKNRPISIKSTIQNLWSFMSILNRINKSTAVSLF